MTRKMFLLMMFSAIASAQTVPPTPVLQSASSIIGKTTITLTVNGCGTTTCGLSDCSCWQQIYRAQCTSVNSCPAITTGSPYVFLNNATYVGNSISGGEQIIWTDQDSVLAAGTIWNYFMTSNYANYTPFTTSPPVQTGALVVPGAVSTVPFSIYVSFSNPQCVIGNTCTANVYRALCTGTDPDPAFACPGYVKGSTFYQLLPATDLKGNSYYSSTVSGSGTNFTYKDDGNISGNIGYADRYVYAATNTFVANPSGEGNAVVGAWITTPIAHQATINYSNSSCVNASMCTLQVWRATCTSSTNCPTYSASSPSWKKLDMTGLVDIPSNTGTTWRYQDTDVALANSTTYVWVATATYVGGSGNASPASAPFIGTTAPTRILKGISNAKNDSTSTNPSAAIRPN